MKKNKSAGIELERNFEITKKGEQKIQINAHLTAVCLLGAGYLFSTIQSDSSIVTIIICQILCPIPLLITSSMSYLKMIVSNSQNCALYDILAWSTHSLAYGMILNAITLIAVYKGFILTAQIFFVSYNVLYVLYSIVNIHVQSRYLMLNQGELTIKAFKKRKIINLIIYLLISFVGGLLPILITN